MNKQLKIWACIVMIAAVLMMAVCSVTYFNLGSELKQYQQQLDESRAIWEKIAAEKEELQNELKDKQRDLNKAQLDLEEANGDIEQVKADIEQLTAEIEALKKASD